MFYPFLKKMLITLSVLFSVSSLNAITYYISPIGNDSNNGTSLSTPWQSINKLNSINLASGTIVLFEGGKNFAGTISLTANDANDTSNVITISSYGTGKATIQSGSGVGLDAYNTKGFTISNLIFEGSGISTNTTNGVKIFTDLSGNVKLGNIKILNTEIRNYGLAGLLIYSSNNNTGFINVLIDKIHIHDVKENGLYIGGYSSPTWVGWPHKNISITNSEINNVPGYADPNGHRGSGIIIAQVDNALIENCVAHHNGTANSHCGGPGGIWAFDCNAITIQHCESYLNSSGSGCDGLGFDLDGGITNSIMQYNYSHQNAGAGYLLGQYDNARPWSNNIVRYNISENDGRTNAGGITLFKGAGTIMNGCKIYNNTIYTSPSAANPNVGAFTVINWNTGITGIEVYNNIFQTTGGVSLIDIPTGYNAFFAGNLYWTTGGAFKIKYQGATYNSVSAWRTATANEKNGSTLTGLTADPLLNNAGSGTIVWPAPTYSLNAYTLGAASPAVNTALDLNNLFAINAGTVDFFNTILPVANQRDIGANERVGPITTAVTETDVEETITETISYYPNPVNGGEVIFVKGGESPYTLELFTLNGSTIIREKLQGSEYHVPEGFIASGLYIIRIMDNKEKIVSGKIIIR